VTMPKPSAVERNGEREEEEECVEMNLKLSILMNCDTTNMYMH
jgi:hypothetical protein